MRGVGRQLVGVAVQVEDREAVGHTDEERVVLPIRGDLDRCPAHLAVVAREHPRAQDLRDQLGTQTHAERGAAALSVVVEPDFFGYLMSRASMGTGPDALPAKTHFSDVPECAALPETGDTPARGMEAALIDCSGLPEPGDVDYAAP